MCLNQNLFETYEMVTQGVVKGNNELCWVVGISKARLKLMDEHVKHLIMFDISQTRIEEESHFVKYSWFKMVHVPWMRWSFVGGNGVCVVLEKWMGPTYTSCKVRQNLLRKVNVYRFSTVVEIQFCIVPLEFCLRFILKILLSRVWKF